MNPDRPQPLAQKDIQLAETEKQFQEFDSDNMWGFIGQQHAIGRIFEVHDWLTSKNLEADPATMEIRKIES